MNHIWRPLVEKAGYQMSDLPKTWDAFYDFFKEVQKKLRAQGVRNVYGLGFQMAAIGGDSNLRTNDFLIAYGGQDIVTKDGKLHLDDPNVRKAAIEMLTYPTTAYKDGFEMCIRDSSKSMRGWEEIASRSDRFSTKSKTRSVRNNDGGAAILR